MATPVKWAGEFTIGGGLIGSQGVTALKSGHFVVAAMKFGLGPSDSIDIAGIKYGNTAAAGAASYLNTAKQFTQSMPEIATLANGNYVVVWDGNDGTSNTGIKAQVFSPGGAKLGGEFQVNTATAGSQQFADITPLSNGKFLVHWAINASGTTQDNCQIFNANGSKSGGDFNIGNDLNAGERIVTAAMAGGTFAAIIKDGFGNLQLQRYSATGTQVGSDTKVSLNSTDNTQPGGLDTLTDGRLAASWVYFDNGPKLYHIYVRLFNTIGTAASPVIDVASVGTSSSFNFTDIVALKDGRAIVSWVKDEGSTVSIYGRLINANGSVNGNVFKINTAAISEFAIGDERDYDVTLLADGRVVYSWTSNTLAPIKAQIIDPREAGVTVNGTAGVDSFVGTRFADRFTSNGGADNFNGGLGNDTYVLGANTAVVITDAGGSDTVESTITRTLAAGSVFENITLLGAAPLNATGNGVANTLKGNTGANILKGLGGADTLDPGTAGTDRLEGGDGGDIYALGGRTAGITIVDPSGIDTISSTVTRSLAPYNTATLKIENLILLGTGNINGTGNSLVNVITGNAGINILDGGNDAVVDILKGGANNDRYVLYAVNDDIQDTSGTDTIQSAFTKNLGDAKYLEIENLVLTGVNPVNGTGNALHNAVTGNSGNNVLSGGDGHDTLDPGSAGTDTLAGGNQNDTYKLGSRTTGITITEASGGSSGPDTILSAVTRSLLDFSNVENLSLTGNGAADITGNDFDNRLIGNAAANEIIGGNGLDTMSGNGGNDEYRFSKMSHSTVGAPDVITDFSAGDKLDLYDIGKKLGVSFKFIADDPFTGSQLEVRWEAVNLTDIAVQVNEAGDTIADFSVILRNVTSIAFGDLILS